MVQAITVAVLDPLEPVAAAGARITPGREALAGLAAAEVITITMAAAEGAALSAMAAAVVILAVEPAS